MKPSNLSRNRLSKISRFSSSRKKETCLNSEIKVCAVRGEILSALLTMTFIARQLGFKVSLNVSGKEL